VSLPFFGRRHAHLKDVFAPSAELFRLRPMPEPICRGVHGCTFGRNAGGTRTRLGQLLLESGRALNWSLRRDQQAVIGAPPHRATGHRRL